MPFFADKPFRPVDETPIYRQLYDYLRGAILSGQLKMGTRLPSTRVLAAELGVSRNTILGAYDQLFAEGYLEAAVGKGTFVTRTLPEALLTAAAPRPRKTKTTKRRHAISHGAAALMQTREMPGAGFAQRPSMAFKTGAPALDQFPYNLWAKLVSRHAYSLHPDALVYQDPAGYLPLRQAIADHVLLARQVRCTPEQVIMVTGAQSGIHLAARVLLNPGDEVWIEDPGYLGARRALVAAGAKLVPVPVDAEGLRLDAAVARAPRARLAYLTPSHQFPLGLTLSLRRRLDLLEWARHSGGYILEDDYDSEFRFSGRPLASLQGLDESESVIYVGTFSKVVFPSLRLGYLIVPPGLVDAVLAYRSATEYHLPVLEQAALADFVTEGHFARHIRRMRALYAERRALLLEALQDSVLDLDAAQTGMHLIGWLPRGMSDTLAAERAAANNVRVLPVSTFAIEAPVRSGLLLGYASTDAREIRAGAERLNRALNGL